MANHDHDDHVHRKAGRAGHCHGHQARQISPEEAERGGYICPMCAGVWSPVPAACPKCGMALDAVDISAETGPNPELVDMTRRFWIAASLTLPLMIIAMGRHMAPGIFGMAPAWALGIAELVLATPVVIWCGKPFLERGWASIRTGNPNMFTLIMIGTGAAFLFSILAVAAPAIFPSAFKSPSGAVGLYFEAAAVIITLVLLGQVLEIGARERASGALRALLDLTPKTVRLINGVGGETEVALSSVSVGDRLRLRPGDAVPVDGIIVEGSGAVDQSMVTGEPIPVSLGVGDPVIGGTLNGNSTMIIRAERVGSETLLARIVQLVAAAQRSRAPIQALADRVSGFFVPAVVIVALLAFAAWALWGPPPSMAHGLVAAVSVLIIACPCALGLATPMSIMVASGRGAETGILIRDAEALERLASVDTVLLDKTGTLTEGQPRLVEIIPGEGFEAVEVLGYAATLELGSAHPLASAIVAEAEARRMPLAEPKDFVSDTGHGVHGTVQGRTVMLGSARYLEAAGLSLAGFSSAAAKRRASGATVLFAAIDGEVAGMLVIADEIKSTAEDTVASLAGFGIEVIMLTGDNEVTANAVAARLDIKHVEADLLPEDKHGILQALREDGRVVAMVGDGINDAPALAQADVGIAMGTGSDIAMESAGVTLVGGDLSALVRAITLGRATMANIRQNLFFAFAYNAIGIPIAAGLLYPLFGLLLSPMIAAAAMSLSSVSVISNALRLKRVRL
jgi:Cu+-exporting ATPase